MSIEAKIIDANGNVVGDMHTRLPDNIQKQWGGEFSYDYRRLKQEVAKRFGVGIYNFAWYRTQPNIWNETYLPDNLTITVDADYLAKSNHLFDTDELFFAWEQMHRNQKFEDEEAKRAAEFLQEKIHETSSQISAGWTHKDHGYNELYPIPLERRISISHCQYDAYPSEVLKSLKSKLGSKIEVIHDGNGKDIRGHYAKHDLAGINIHATCFLLKLGPDDGFKAGTEYVCYFSEYDSHASGW